MIDLFAQIIASMIGRVVQAIRFRHWKYLTQKPEADQDDYSLAGGEFFIRILAVILLVMAGALCIVFYAIVKFGLDF